MSAKKPIPQPSHLKKVPDNQLNAFDRWEAYLQRNQTRLLLLLPLILGVLFATLTFDMKISEGNDDAMYIEAASKYAADFTGYFYTANAPFYPLVLGIVTMATGLHLTIFKLLNVFFFLLHLALFYYAFRKRMPLVILWPVLLFSSLNSYLLYYASQTYTEMLFLTLQAFFFIVFFNWYEKLKAPLAAGNKLLVVGELQANNSAGNTKKGLLIRGALAIGGALFLMTFCKNIAIGMLAAVSLFLLLQQQYRMLLLTVAGYMVVRLGFEGVKAVIWGAGNQYGSQSAILLQKDAYNAAAGQEDFSGLLPDSSKISTYTSPSGSSKYLALKIPIAWKPKPFSPYLFSRWCYLPPGAFTEMCGHKESN
ncbi:MAG: hypothetical protein IPP71_20005 [Bacteroidetes bacterium]|nr:hypothetical protein [Bacteroidota bacterium]